MDLETARAKPRTNCTSDMQEHLSRTLPIINALGVCWECGEVVQSERDKLQQLLHLASANIFSWTDMQFTHHSPTQKKVGTLAANSQWSDGALWLTVKGCGGA